METRNRQSRNRGGARKGSASYSGGGRSRSGGNRSYGGRKRNGGGRGRSGGRGGRKMSTFDPSRFINTNPAELQEEVYTPQHAFSDFGLDPTIVQTVTDLDITIPTPIQDQIIPEILNGRDVIGLAETGTGKTAAFLLPLIEKTRQDMKHQTLIMAPTRELALQIQSEMKKLSKGLRMFSVICVGGMNIYPQIKEIRHKNHFIIGTPGRLIDLMERGEFKPEQIRTVVLDEADRMLDMGFIHDMRKILSRTPEDRETLLFSATMSKQTEAIVHDFLRNPVVISVKKKDVTNSIEQDIVPHGHHDKFETLTSLLHDKDTFKRVLVFGAMKHSVEKLSRELSKHGVPSESIHGNKNHAQRQRALQKFKSGAVQVLVATDVAARGIHVDDVTHVINYELPNTFEDYVHRIGRTGRGTKRGKALTFVHTR